MAVSYYCEHDLVDPVCSSEGFTDVRHRSLYVEICLFDRTCSIGSLNIGISQLKFSWFRHPKAIADLGTYDGASRGLWGSIHLLRLRGASLPSLGAIVTISAIGIGPFTQQSVVYEVCGQRNLTGVASVVRANSYTEAGVHLGAAIASLEYPMRFAIERGFYNSSDPIVPTCTSGNCTFNDFRSVGMCSRCVDDGASVNFTYARFGAAGIEACALSSTPGCSIGLWNLTSAPLVNLTLTGGDGDLSIVQRSDVSPPFASVEGSPIIARSRMLTFTVGPSSDQSPNATLEPGNIRGQPNVLATICTLYPCVRTYSLSVMSGRATEIQTSSFPMHVVAEGLSNSDPPGEAAQN